MHLQKIQGTQRRRTADKIQVSVNEQTNGADEGGNPANNTGSLLRRHRAGAFGVKHKTQGVCTCLYSGARIFLSANSTNFYAGS